MLKLKILSDIHLEFQKHNRFTVDPIPNLNTDDISVLVLAGDIGHPMTIPYCEFLTKVKQDFNYVLVVAGNHEYYKQKKQYHDMAVITEQITKICNEVGCVFLNRSSVDIHGVKFLGCTLWSHVPDDMKKYASESDNDYHNICTNINDVTSKVTVDYLNSLHVIDREWLENQLHDTNKQKTVVITHFMPSYQLISEKYIGNPLNCCFATNLEYLFRGNLTWICGHTHCAKECEIYGTHCIINPVGYPGEKTGSNKDKVWEIRIELIFSLYANIEKTIEL